MKAGVVLLLAVVVACLASGLGRGDDKKEDPAKKEFDRLQGRWDYVSVKTDGKEATADEIKGAYREYKGDKVTTRASRTGTVKLDPTKTPGQIDVTWNGPGGARTDKGIYMIEGDTLTICYAIPSKVKDRPTEFKTGEGLTLFVSKKAK